jgi:vang-like
MAGVDMHHWLYGLSVAGDHGRATQDAACTSNGTLFGIYSYNNHLQTQIIWMNTTRPWPTSECQVDCQGQMISFAFKLLILLAAVWALFVRRSVADMPRLFVARACILAMLFLLTFAYWLFYGVRIVETRVSDSGVRAHARLQVYEYALIVTFALSLVDALLFVHYLAVVLLELRALRPEYRVHVIRSPDGCR